MTIWSMLIVIAGMLCTLGVVYAAVTGPSPGRAGARRLVSVRERHTKSDELAAQAQLKRILASRTTKMDSFAQRFIPNPKLLRQRISIRCHSQLVRPTLQHHSTVRVADSLTTPWRMD